MVTRYGAAEHRMAFLDRKINEKNLTFRLYLDPMSRKTQFSDVALGDMPSGMPDSILRDLDWNSAIRLIAEDIADNCGKPVSECEISQRLMEADKPISFTAIENHIPDAADYTADEIVGLYCTVASLRTAPNYNGGELESAMLETDSATNSEEYSEAQQNFDRIWEKISSISFNRYNEWMAACYA